MVKPKALSIILDSSEPDWVKELKFGDTPISISNLPTGDVWVALQDELIVIERKTMSDLIGSIDDGRLFAQAAEMADASKWAYVVLHDRPHIKDGQIMIAGTMSGWTWARVAGALLKVQEIGVNTYISMSSAKDEFKRVILRLANHDRGPIVVRRKREVQQSFPAMDLLTSIKGISETRANQLLAACGSAVDGLVALQQNDYHPRIKGFPWKSLVKNTRIALGLRDDSETWEEITKIVKEKSNE